MPPCPVDASSGSNPSPRQLGVHPKHSFISELGRCSTGASRQAAPGQTFLQTGARSRMGSNRARGQSSHFQKPPEQHSPASKSSTALQAQQHALPGKIHLQMDFQRYFSLQIHKLKSGGVLKGRSLGNQVSASIKLLNYSGILNAAVAETFPGSPDKRSGAAVWRKQQFCCTTLHTPAWQIQAPFLSGSTRCSKCFAEPSKVPAWRHGQHLPLMQGHEKLLKPNLGRSIIPSDFTTSSQGKNEG